MKVLIVHRHLEFYGGAETVVVKLATYLNRKGIKTSIVALSPLPPDLRESEELDIIIPKKRFRHKLRAITLRDSLETLGEINALRKLVRANMSRFDLLNLHNFPATWSFFPDHKPSVWMLNEPIGLWHNVKPSLTSKILNEVDLMLDRYVVNRCIDTICVADEFNAERCHAIYGRRPEIIPYGIEYDVFSNGNAQNARQSFSLEDCFTLVQVGQITASKNQFESVKAVEKLKDYIPNIKLVLVGVGDPPYMEMLKRYIDPRKLSQFIIFTGHLPKHIISDLYHACDVAVFPIGSQGGFLSPFEALSASKPIVISTKMSIADIVRKEAIGVVTDDFVKSILEVYNSPSLYRHMAERGRQFVAENLTYDRFGDRMLATFEQVLGQS